MIRDVELTDGAALRTLYTNAFPAEESPLVGSLAVDLLAEESTPQTLSLVWEEAGEVTGHICFSPVFLTEGALRVFILCPLAVHTTAQKKGIGSKLIRHGLDRLSDLAVDVVLVYGDPGYYGRFGFDAGLGEVFIPPYPIEHAFGWQGLALGQGAQAFQETKRYHCRCAPPLQKPDYW